MNTQNNYGGTVNNADSIAITNNRNRSEISEAIDIASGVIRAIEVVGQVRQGFIAKSKVKDAEATALRWLQEAKNHENQGNTTAQINCLLRAIEINPNLANAYNSLAWVLASGRRELEKALECANRATYLRPNCACYYDTLAEVYFQQGDYQQAMRISQEALNLSRREDKNTDFLVFHRAGRIHLGRKEYDESISAFQQCLKINSPNSGFDMAGVFFGIAICLKQSGALVPAYKHGVKALELRPDRRIAQFIKELENS